MRPTNAGVVASGTQRGFRVARLKLQPMSLRLQVALVIALLSALPNVVMVMAMVLPAYQRAGELPGGVWPQALLWLAGVVVLSVVMGYILSGMLLAPLLRAAKDVAGLPHTAQQLSAARLPVGEDEPAEVAALRRAFNGLLAQVELQQQRRNSFMAALMHDLKTPLVATTNLLTVVRDDDDLSRERRVEVISRLTTELRSLTELVQKMVDAHRLERSDVPLHRAAVQLEVLLLSVLERLVPLLDERGVTMTVRGEGVAKVDAREVERALYNLLSNAVRYASSRIDVEIYPGMIRIQDDGPGLPEPLETLAQPFTGRTVEIAGSSYASGTGGLGLFIARRVLEAHGGRLVCEATGPGGTVLLAYLGPR